MPEYVFGMQLSCGGSTPSTGFYRSLSRRLAAFVLILPELSSCMLREWPFDCWLRMGVLSPSSSKLVSRISPMLLVLRILAWPLAGSWSKFVSKSAAVAGGAGGKEEGE